MRILKIRGADGKWLEVPAVKGTDGATFTPHMSVSGDLSWTNDKGLTNPQTINLMGKNGIWVGTDTPPSGYDVWVDTDAPLNSGDVEEYIREMVDARTGYDGTVYNSVGTAVREQVGSLEDQIESFSEIVGILPMVWEQGSISSSTGATLPDSYANHARYVRASDYIAVKNGVSITIPSTEDMRISKYDADKNFLGNKSLAGPSYAPGVVLPSDAAYIRLVLYHRATAGITPDYAEQNVSAVFVDSAEGRFTSLKLCTYGDSITKNQAWANNVRRTLHFAAVYNRGWSDSAVTLENKMLYINADGTYAGNPISEEQPEGTTAVQCSFCHDDRIAYVPTDSDIVLIMGGTNDLIRNKPIGVIPTDGNYDENTFVGALISTVKKMHERVPDATIILMTPIIKVSAKGAVTPDIDTNGHTIVDFVEAVRDVADYTGCNLIDVHKCGITLFNSAELLSDATHPNNSGHRLIANAVISGLKRIFPI